jgi:RNA polymerase sigma factor (sigma-70 family)
VFAELFWNNQRSLSCIDSQLSEATTVSHNRTRSSKSFNSDWAQVRLDALHFAKLWCPNLPDAEDVAQDAIVSLLSHVDRIDNVQNWLFVVTKRLAFRAIRTRVSRFPLLSPASRQNENRVALEQRSLIHHVVKDRVLRTRDRRLIWLAMIGCSHAQIAARIGCSARDIGQHLRRAAKRAALRYRLTAVEKTERCQKVPGV